MAKAKALDPAASLAKAIEESFVRRRSENAGYPASLREVARDVAADISEADLRAALAKAPATTRPVLAIDGDLDSLAVLNHKEDIARLAGDERLLQLLCERLCSPQSPLISVKELADAGVLVKKLQAAFKAHWGARLKSGTLPSFVHAATDPQAATKATSLKLHDVRFPLPWMTLSKALVQALQQSAGASGVMMEWSTLVAQVPGADQEKVVALARASEPYQSQVIPVFAKEPHGWLVLIENAERCARDPRVLDRVFRAILKSGDTAVEVGALKKQKLLSPPLALAFSQFADEIVVNRPAGLGVLYFSNKVLLFRLRDLPGSTLGGGGLSVPPREAPREPEVALPVPTSVSGLAFAEAFDRQYSRLNALEAGYNLVKLWSLRQALPQYSRAEFDTELRTLRLARRYSLMPSEGRGVTLSDAEQEAGIQEAGTRLVYCSRMSGDAPRSL